LSGNTELIVIASSIDSVRTPAQLKEAIDPIVAHTRQYSRQCAQYIAGSPGKVDSILAESLQW
jgi:hypothetical protein